MPPQGGFSVQAVIDRIAAKNIEAVVCDTSTPSILNDVSVVEAMVVANPSLHVLMVGRHVSSLPKETLAMSSSLQAVAIREYEYTVPRLAGSKGMWRGPVHGRWAGLAQCDRRDHQQQATRSYQESR